MLTVGFKNAVSIELTAFLAFFVFCKQVSIRLPKKSFDFLERGKTYVVYLQNFVLFYTEYVLTRYSSHSQENEIQNLSQQPKKYFFDTLQYNNLERKLRTEIYFHSQFCCCALLTVCKILCII